MPEIFSHLLDLAAECRVWDAMQAMFSGEKINQTENRSVLHTALRNFSGEPVYSDGKDVMPGVMQELEHMKYFCQTNPFRRVARFHWQAYPKYCEYRNRWQ